MSLRSPRSPKRFSKEGFQRLSPTNSDEMLPPPLPPQPSGNPNDVTIDIPLTKVRTSRSTGARKAKFDPSDEKTDPALDGEATVHHSHSHSHFRRTGGRRRKLEAQGKNAKLPEDGSLTVMGRIYNKIYHFSLITRYLLYVIPVALLISIPIIVGGITGPVARIGGTRITFFFTWVEVVWCSIWVAKLVAHFLPFVFQFIVGVVSSGTRKYALILAALEIPLSLVGWTVTSLATFRPLMTKTPGRGPANYEWIDIMEKILAACVFSTLVLLAEKVLIQLISISYHRKQFDSKIKDSKRNIYLVGRLYEASKAMFPTYCPEFAEEDYIISDVLGITNLANANPGHKRSGSHTPMRILQNVQRVGGEITTAFGNMASEITGKQVFNPTASHSIVVQALEKRRSSEALARRLWLSFVLEGKDALHLDDMTEVFGVNNETEAEEIFSALDVDANGDVSLDEMILRISEFGRERSALANSMRDVDQAIAVLDNLLLTVVFILCVFIFVAMLNQNFTTTLATAGTALLSLSFVFSVTAQELLGSCIFLFVKHPYDVGDRVDILKEQLVVEKISLLYTMFRKVQDHKRTQVPNIVLNSLWVDNISRSKAMREQISLFINFDTTFEDIELLRKEMQVFVQENGRDYQPDIDIEVLDLAEMNKMQLSIEIRHKSNWSIETVRAARRSKFMCALVQAMRRVPIYGPGAGGPGAGEKANPTYSVAISDTEAQESKEEFAKQKEAKRMVPTPKPEVTTATSSSIDYLGGPSFEAKEEAQVQELNQRRVVVDPTNQGRGDLDPFAMDRQRSNDLEEVKNIMRRQTTVGRRKREQQAVIEEEEEPARQTQSQSSIFSGAQAQQMPSYYEDSAYAGPSASGASATYAPAGSQSSIPYPAPLQTQQVGRYRSESNAQTPTDYKAVPGNAFSQQHQPLSPPRQTASGPSQMKGASQQGPPGPR